MRASSRAFTLVEVAVAIAVMLILAGAMVPMVGRAVQTQRENRTREQLKAAHEALFGARDRQVPSCRADFGFQTTSLADLRVLVSRVGTPWAGVPAFDNASGFYAGWNGPYWTTPVDGLNRPLDAFGNVIQLNDSWQTVSPGQDRTLGTADDLVYPPTPVSVSAYQARVNLIITKSLFNVAGQARMRFMYGASPGVTTVSNPALPAIPAVGSIAVSTDAWLEVLPGSVFTRTLMAPAGSVQLQITPTTGTFPPTTFNMQLAPGEARDIKLTF